ncbi:MAG: phosphoribosylformimino-5-aminoimidazole carboxamide ribotide isomerase [Lachnospiraceae bacterium]|nr:phosphoribosylformimino-5-aminoimidazole carboxamide ribotide isomerase [Lachnospiraceae bacterium]
MQFRPCIDIHNGKVKQIVGGSLRDVGDTANENFVSEQDAAFFANLYKAAGLKGGHVIMLNSPDSEYFEATKEQALLALRTYSGGLQAGGGINPDNAGEFLSAGASHVIVTSYAFKDGVIHFDRLKKLVKAVGKERLVLDVSCRRTENGYKVVTDRWQKLTGETVDGALLDRLSEYCDEFLIHAVDVEGKAQGIEQELVKMMGGWNKLPVTYAGGVHSTDDLELIRELGQNRVNFTVGSALDIFGGNLRWEEVIKINNKKI